MKAIGVPGIDAASQYLLQLRWDECIPPRSNFRGQVNARLTVSMFEYMPEDPENWWDSNSEESKQEAPDAPDAPEPIAIRGYQREGDQWVRSDAKDTTEPSSGERPKKPPSEFSNYQKQKIGATALFLVSFSVGDWWWDGSHGIQSLINSIESITYMPGSLMDSYEFWTSQEGFNSLDAMLITISWMLWDISTLVFSVGFALCWGGWSKDNKTEANRILNGKRSYNFLLYFSVALISMDILSYSVWSGLLGVFEWPFDFIEWHIWQAVAILAAIGLNPDFDFVGGLTSQSAKE